MFVAHMIILILLEGGGEVGFHARSEKFLGRFWRRKRAVTNFFDVLPKLAEVGGV